MTSPGPDDRASAYTLSLEELRVVIDATVADVQSRYPGITREVAADTLGALVKASKDGAANDMTFAAEFDGIRLDGAARGEHWALWITDLITRGKVRS